ncbi:MAG: DUF493 family protein [Bacteroidetes bacterium]|nr:MAG: DUF493 family protein [Bacteroidota bacterium]TAG86632.1 MAG: DUF493 family protein [Bacteroidota bacterium]
MQSQQPSWETLKTKLDETESFPLLYMFKFVLPSDNHKIALLTKQFEEQNGEITMRTSATGKHTSITIRLVVLSSEEVINHYKRATNIEGVIML